MAQMAAQQLLKYFYSSVAVNKVCGCWYLQIIEWGHSASEKDKNNLGSCIRFIEKLNFPLRTSLDLNQPCTLLNAMCAADAARCFYLIDGHEKGCFFFSEPFSFDVPGKRYFTRWYHLPCRNYHFWHITSSLEPNKKLYALLQCTADPQMDFERIHMSA